MGFQGHLETWTVTALVVAMVVAALLLAVRLGRWAFDRKVKAEVSALAASAPATGPRRTSNLNSVPDPVRRYLRYAGALDRPPTTFVRLEHGGTFRTAPNRDWMPIEGVEHFTTDRPGFVWYAVLHAAPLLTIRARDYYLQGEGNMLVKLLSLVPLADVRGPELDQGALLRYLAETPWFPSALLPGGPIEWSAVDESSARATLKDGTLDVSAVFHFGALGEVTAVEAERARSVDGGFAVDPWGGRYREYVEMDGFRIPTEAEVAWRLDTGAFPYARFKVTEVAFDSA